MVVLIVPKKSYEFWSKRKVLIWGVLSSLLLMIVYKLGRKILTFTFSQKNICTRFLYVISEVREPPGNYFIHFKSCTQAEISKIFAFVYVYWYASYAAVTNNSTSQWLNTTKVYFFLLKDYCESGQSVFFNWWLGNRANCLLALSLQNQASVLWQGK